MVRETPDTHNNDNDELSFIQLAAATANAVRWLLEQTNNEEKNSANDERSKNADSDEPARSNLKIG